MQIGLKERLIGAVVLVILAVIIIPWVLKGGSAPSTTVTKPLTLPQATTAVSATTAPQAYHLALNNTATNASVALPPAAATTQPAAVIPATAPGANSIASSVNAQAAKPAAQSLPMSAKRAVAGKWVVQAGSYSNETNARSVERKLAKRGYHAYISRYHKGNRLYYRVRVGPYEDKMAAERIVTAVSRAYGGRAQVVPDI